MPMNQSSAQLRVYLFAAIFGCYFIVELIMSHMSHSLTLLVDAYHTLYNFMALVSYIIAIKMSNEHRLKNTFGWARIEVLSVLVSILALGALCFSTVVEAVQTVVHASHSETMHHPLIVLIIGVTGLGLNLICFLFVGGFSYSESFLHVSPQEVQVNVTLPQSVIAGTKFLTSSEISKENERHLRWKFIRDFCWDISCSILVIICSVVVYQSVGQLAFYIDPTLSILAATILISTSCSFVKESGMILLQTVPGNMDVGDLKDRLMKEFPTIKGVHDLHIWRLTKLKVIATAHIMFESHKAYTQTAEYLSIFFRNEGISNTTIQPEFIETAKKVSPLKTQCALRCGTAECEPRTCCNDQLVEENIDEKNKDATEKGINTDTTDEIAQKNIDKQNNENPADPEKLPSNTYISLISTIIF